MITIRPSSSVDIAAIESAHTRSIFPLIPAEITTSELRPLPVCEDTYIHRVYHFIHEDHGVVINILIATVITVAALVFTIATVGLGGYFVYIAFEDYENYVWLQERIPSWNNLEQITHTNIDLANQRASQSLEERQQQEQVLVDLFSHTHYDLHQIPNIEISEGTGRSIDAWMTDLSSANMESPVMKGVIHNHRVILLKVDRHTQALLPRPIVLKERGYGNGNWIAYVPDHPLLGVTQVVEEYGPHRAYPCSQPMTESNRHHITDLLWGNNARYELATS